MRLTFDLCQSLYIYLISLAKISGEHLQDHWSSDLITGSICFYFLFQSDLWHGTLFLTYCHRTKSGHCMPLNLDGGESFNSESVYSSERDLLDDCCPGPVQFYFVGKINERQSIFGISDQVQHKPGCAATEDD